MTHVRLAEDTEYVAGLGAGGGGATPDICISGYIREFFHTEPTVSAGQLEVVYPPLGYDLCAPTRRTWRG